MKIKYIYLFVLALAIIACQSDTSGEKETSDLAFAFEQEATPTEMGSVFPSLHVDGDGKLRMTWQQVEDSLTYLRTAVLENNAWGAPETIAQGENWFVNWADFPNMLTLSDGRMLSFYLPIYDQESYGYNVAIKQKQVDGTWSEPIALYRDEPATTQGFVSFFPLGDKVGTIWLEAENMEGESGSHEEDHGHNMVVRYAAIGADNQLSDEQIVDDYVCTCCQTDAAPIPGGAIVVYRDRSKEEVRDISYIRLQNGTWAAPKPLHEDNWVIHGCPVNGPAIDAKGSTVAATWFTMPEGEGKVWLRFSRDAGETFGEPIRIDKGHPLGRVDVLLVDEERALVSWIEKGDATGSLNIKLVHRDGKILEDQAVSPFEPIRPTGFPRLAMANKKIFITWTEGAMDDATIKMMSAPVRNEQVSQLND